MCFGEIYSHTVGQHEVQPLFKFHLISNFEQARQLCTPFITYIPRHDYLFITNFVLLQVIVTVKETTYRAISSICGIVKSRCVSGKEPSEGR